MYWTWKWVRLCPLVFTSGTLCCPATSWGQAVTSDASPTADDREVEDVITVTATRRRVLVDRRSYDIGTGPDAAGITSRDALERLPGVIVDIDGELSVIGQPIGTILVDGTYFPQDLALQIPASQIERVEVITNPGAESQNDGVTINLVLKDETRTPRTLTVSGRADTRDRYKLFASFNADDEKWSQIATLTLEDETTLVDTVAELEFLTADQIGQVGERRVAQAIDEASGQLFGILSRKLPGGRKISFVGLGILGDVMTDNDRDFVRRDGAAIILDRAEDGSTETTNASGGLGVSYGREKGEGDTLAVSVNLALAEADRRQRDRVVRDATVGFFDRRVSSANESIFLNANRDKKMNRGRELKLGLQGVLDRNARYIDGTDTTASDGLVPEGSYTYDRGEAALFGSYAFRFGGLTLQPGLRAELLDMTITANGRRAEDDPSYARLLPSLHLAHGLGRFGILKASVAQRTVTPNYDVFDPVRRKVRFDTFEEGDAGLEIGTALNFEASHEIERGKVTLLTTAYHRARTNTIEPFVDFLGDDLFLLRNVNLDNDDETGLNVNLTHKIGTRWEQTLDVNAYRTEQRWSVGERDFDRELETYDVKYNLEYKHDKKRSALLILQQEGPGLDLNAETDSRLSSTLRYVQRFESGLVLTLEGIDLLATNERTAVFESDTLRSVTLTEFQERGLRATLLRKF